MAGEELNSTALSERELQIVELVADGLTNQEIGEKLDISKRTVDNHISNILTKTATENRVALVRWALKWGKVCIDELTCCKLPTVPVSKNGNHDSSRASSNGVPTNVAETNSVSSRDGATDSDYPASAKSDSANFS